MLSAIGSRSLHLSSVVRTQVLASTSTSAQQPWFITEPKPALHPTPVPSQAPPPPSDAPSHLLALHTHLTTSPYLETSSLLLTKAPPAPPLPPLDPRAKFAQPKGRRKRNPGYVGEGFERGMGGGPGVWNWVLIAQVKEGAEGKGAIQAVVRRARETLLDTDPQLPIVSKKRGARENPSDGWGMLDIGDSVLHVVSRRARERWFSRYFGAEFRDEEGGFKGRNDDTTKRFAPY